MKRYLWLSENIYNNWPIYSQGGSVADDSLINRAYKIWERALKLVSNANNDFDRSDVVLTLKRSLDQRLKLIEKTYLFKSKQFEGKPKHYLDILAHLNIIRPLFFHKLLKIRNAIEHEDEKPPSKSECFELVDIVWYFLKSTDPIVSIEKSCFESGGIDTKYGYDLNIDWKKNHMEMSGWFPIEFVSEESRPGFIKVKISKRGNKTAFSENKEITKYHRNKSETDTWLIGEPILSPAQLLKFYRKIFSLYS